MQISALCNWTLREVLKCKKRKLKCSLLDPFWWDFWPSINVETFRYDEAREKLNIIILNLRLLICTEPRDTIVNSISHHENVCKLIQKALLRRIYHNEPIVVNRTIKTFSSYLFTLFSLVVLSIECFLVNFFWSFNILLVAENDRRSTFKASQKAKISEEGWYIRDFIPLRSFHETKFINYMKDFVSFSSKIKRISLRVVFLKRF